MVNTETLRQLESLIAEDQGALRDWSLNYFQHHHKRYDFDLDTIAQYYTAGKILEVGSAPYHLTWLMEKRGLPVTGIDIDPSRQKEFIQRAELEIIACNIEKEPLPFPNRHFHYVIFNEIFEHLRINPIETLRELRRVLHPDGILVLSTPNLYSIRNIVNMIRGKGFDNPYSEFNKLNTIGHMGHVREYSLRQVQEFLANTGFRIISSKTVSHYPLKGLWRLFNPIRKIFPSIHAYQVHICGVDKPSNNS